MCETTIRKKIKEIGLCLKSSTEMYTGEKNYSIHDEKGELIIAYNSLDDLSKVFLISQKMPAKCKIKADTQIEEYRLLYYKRASIV